MYHWGEDKLLRDNHHPRSNALWVDFHCKSIHAHFEQQRQQHPDYEKNGNHQQLDGDPFGTLLHIVPVKENTKKTHCALNQLLSIYVPSVDSKTKTSHQTVKSLETAHVCLFFFLHPTIRCVPTCLTKRKVSSRQKRVVGPLSAAGNTRPVNHQSIGRSRLVRACGKRLIRLRLKGVKYNSNQLYMNPSM